MNGAPANKAKKELKTQSFSLRVEPISKIGLSVLQSTTPLET